MPVQRHVYFGRPNFENGNSELNVVFTLFTGGHCHLANELETVTMNIKREFFAAILAQPCRKGIEYRLIKPYWNRKLEPLLGKRFKLRLLNGMLPPVPEATIMVEKLVRDSRQQEWQLHLGRVIEVKNWDRKRELPL